MLLSWPQFYERPWYEAPSNMWTPFEEKEQPPDDTWANHTLGKVALRVHQINARSSAMHNTQAVMDETVTALSTEVRRRRRWQGPCMALPATCV